MRPLLLTAVLLAPIFAGCFAATEGPAPPAIASLAPSLGEPIGLEGGELLSRNETSAVLSWKGSLPSEAVRRVSGPSEVLVPLTMPGDVPLRVSATVTWTGTAGMRLFIADANANRCSTDGAEGSAQPITGEASCTVWWADPAPEDRAWRIFISAAGGTADTSVQLTVTVTALVTPPQFDIRNGPTGAATVPDASIAGPLTVANADYDMGVMTVADSVTGRSYPVRIVGTAFYPTSGDGPFPVVVLVHGRHDTCENGVLPASPFQHGRVSHCRSLSPVVESVKSHRGYDAAVALLVSHGYVAISIDANDINELDSPGYAGRRPFTSGDDGLVARAQLILRTLDGFRDIHAGNGVPMNLQLASLMGRLDLGRIGLVGHSRGAESVTHTPSYAASVGHWSAGKYGAVYAIGGTPRFYLGLEASIVPAPTAYASVTPYCDGDAFWLGNVEYHEAHTARADTGPLVNLVFMGANHNYYNSAWPQDDANFAWQNDPYCRPDGTEDGLGYGRLSPEDQNRHQNVYLPAFFRLYLGGEAAFAPLFTGAASPPPAACPVGVASCPGLVQVSYQPPADGRLDIASARTAAVITTNDLGGASTFTGFDTAAWYDPFANGVLPWDHPGHIGLAPRISLAWTGDATWRTTMPTTDLTAHDVLAFRIAVEEAFAPLDIRLTVEDARGARASATVNDHSAALFVAPGEHGKRLVLNQARIPLSAFAGIDLANVRAVELSFAGATPGAVHVAELLAMRTTS